MQKKLKKMGNSQAIIIDKTIQELTGINSDTTLEIKVFGRKIVIEPVEDLEKQAKLNEALDFANENYNETLKKLAE